MFGADPNFSNVKGGRDTLKGIWNPDKPDAPDKRPRRDIEEEEKAARSRKQSEEKTASLREKLATLEHQAALDALDDNARINELVAERAALLKQASDANAERKPERELEAKIRAAEIDKEILAAREKADQEAARRMDQQQKQAEQIAQQRASLEEKAFRNGLADMSDADKKAALEQRRAEAYAKLNSESDPSKKLGIASDILDLNGEIGGLSRNKARGGEVSADSLTKAGLGGAAYFSKPGADDSQRALRTAEQTRDLLERATAALDQINAKSGAPDWQR